MIIEVTTFRPKDGTAHADLVAADAAVQQELSAHHPGLIRRTTARDESGEWVVVTLWWEMENAQASAERKDEPALARFWSLVEAVRVGRYEDLGG